MRNILLILILFCLFFFPASVVAQPSIPQPSDRPADCRLTEQCAKLSTDGKDLTIYYKEQSSVGLQEDYSYAAIAREVHDAGQYIYKSKQRDFYIRFSIGDSVSGDHITHHYKTGENIDWDQNPGNQQYKHLGDGKAPTGIDDSGRYSWKPFIYGTVNLESGGSSTTVDDAKVDMWLNTGVIANGSMSESKGPLVGREKSDSKGFKFERKGSFWSDNMIFLSVYSINNIVLCASYEDKATNKKYQKTVKIPFSADWPKSGDDGNALVKNDVQITFTPQDEVSDWLVKPGSAFQGPITEVIGAGNSWEDAVTKKVLCWVANIFITVLYWESNLAAFFLRRNY